MDFYTETTQARIARRISAVEANLHLASMRSSVLFILDDVRALLARGDEMDAQRRLDRAADYIWSFGDKPAGW